MRKDIANQLKNIREEEILLLNKSELVRRFNCSRATVNKYLNPSENVQRKPRTVKKKLDGFESTILEKVDNYGSSSMAVYKFLQKKGYEGGYQTINTFVKKHKNTEIKKATIRFDTSPGLQA